MKRYVSVRWISIALVVIAVIAYSASRFCDSVFRDAAIANLFATILGVLIGVPLALEINRVQEAQRASREAAEESREARQRLGFLYTRLREKFNQNSQRLERFSSALENSSSSRADHWAWLIAMTDGLSFDAATDLVASSLRAQLLPDLDFSIQIATSFLGGLRQRVREAGAAHVFYLGYKADQSAADAQLSFVRDLARETSRRAQEARDLLSRYKHLYPSG